MTQTVSSGSGGSKGLSVPVLSTLSQFLSVMSTAPRGTSSAPRTFPVHPHKKLTGKVVGRKRRFGRHDTLDLRVIEAKDGAEHLPRDRVAGFLEGSELLEGSSEGEDWQGGEGDNGEQSDHFGQAVVGTKEAERRRRLRHAVPGRHRASGVTDR